MGISLELQAQIEETESKIQRDYRHILEKVQMLKSQMNRMERQTPEARDMKALEASIKHLNKLTDSIIIRSKKAWEEYKKLEHESERSATRPTQLDDLNDICRKTEQLATDLLCYSLARFRQNDTRHTE